MDSNRVILPGNLGSKAKSEIYITDIKQSSDKHLNFHTSGKVYAPKIIGLPFRLRLSVKRRKELQQRLEAGQSFY